MADIINYSDENDLLIIEDAAQGIGSKFNNQMAGTFGIAGTYSFYPAKTLGCYGDGGAIVTNDTKIADAIYELRDHGRAKNGDYNRWGINSRLDNIQAAILLLKLKTLDDEISRRREIANRYINGLDDIADLTLPPGPNDNKNYFDTFQNFEIESGERDKLKKYLSNQGIGTIVQWGGKAVHQIKCLGFDIHLPFTDKVFQRCLLLPMNTTLSDDEINYVIENIRSFYKFN
jgi:dTDP-4-amino-4,6-dideoxygalactose transaminase